MKPVVTIPDNLFRRAEELAKLEGKSRDRLYTDALCEYVASHSTEAMNRVCDDVSQRDVGFSRRAAEMTLRNVEWESGD